MEEWNEPAIIEKAVGLEINSYACAAMDDDKSDNGDNGDNGDDSDDDSDDSDDSDDKTESD
jgi:coenzyme PQQ precursor peptide PqqA